MAALEGHASPAVEDYAKAIYALERRGGEAVTTSALAERLDVSPASASAMVKRMDALELVEHEPYHGVRLTKAGERIALEVIRHHRLIELYLAEALGMPWDRVHAEAEVLEHAISPELSELIAEKLGHPSRDPHGDPIPSADGELDEPSTVSLDALEPGSTGTLTRVSDSNPELLRFLASKGVEPGLRLELVERQPFGGPLVVRFADGRLEPLGEALARAIRVEPDRAPAS
jgi:DtxR family Mn-dependent transcriptional regulator